MTASVLPDGSEPEVMAWAEKNYLLPHTSKKYQLYLRPVLAKLQSLPYEQYVLKLKLLDQLIQSLRVEVDE